MPIKTLHLTNAWHPSSGGIRTFYRAMLREANARRQQLGLVVPAAASSMETVGDYGRIYFVKAPRSPIVDSRYRLLLPHTFLRSAGEVWRIVDRERPDLIEVCDKYSLCYLAGMLRCGWNADRPRPTSPTPTTPRANCATAWSPGTGATCTSCRWA
jgi:hypothetical protein